MKKLLAPALLGLGLVSCGTPKATTPTTTINGAGATFPAPLYAAWFHSLAKDHNIKVNYQSIGSGSGVRQYNAGTTDFGASDKAISNKKIKEPVVQIPMTGGAIVPAYNLPGCEVNMSQLQLADVFLGKIKSWKHFGCEDKPILVVHRSDGSGTTAGFTASLSAFSPEWKEKVGAGKAVDWPTGVGSKGNEGVAATIKQQPGAIGYLNYGYVAGDKKLQQVRLENRAGKYVFANAETSSAGLSRIKLDKQLRGSDPNPKGKNSYPIVSLTWVLARPVHPRNNEMKQVFAYMLSLESQSISDRLGYVPLPEMVRQKSLEAVKGLKAE